MSCEVAQRFGLLPRPTSADAIESLLSGVDPGAASFADAESGSPTCDDDRQERCPSVPRLLPSSKVYQKRQKKASVKGHWKGGVTVDGGVGRLKKS